MVPKIGEKVECAYITNNLNKTHRLPEAASIFTADIKTVELALKFIKTFPVNKYIIFLDSLSGLHKFKIDNKDTVKFLNKKIFLLAPKIAQA